MFWLNLAILLQSHQFICVCVSCTLGVLVCNPYLPVCVLTVFLAELLILFHTFADALCYSHTSSYVCHCLFCTLDILDGHPFIAVHPFLHRERFVDCTHKNISVFSRFCVFPSHFFTVNNTSVTMFFSLACPDSFKNAKIFRTNSIFTFGHFYT